MVKDADKLSLTEYYWTSTRYSQYNAYRYNGYYGNIDTNSFFNSFTVSPITLPEDEDFLTNKTPQEAVSPVSEVVSEPVLNSGAKKVVVTTGDVTTVELNGVKIVCK